MIYCTFAIIIFTECPHHCLFAFCLCVIQNVYIEQYSVWTVRPFACSCVTKNIYFKTFTTWMMPILRNSCQRLSILTQLNIQYIMCLVLNNTLKTDEMERQPPFNSFVCVIFDFKQFFMLSVISLICILYFLNISVL